MFTKQILLDLNDRIKNGENEDAKKTIEKSNFYNITDENGCTLLHYAAQHGNLEITQYLLDKRCNVNSQNSLGFSPIMYALRNEHDKVAETLLNSGADLTLFNNENMNSLHFLLARPQTNYIFQKAFIRQFQKHYPIKDELGRKLIEVGCRIDQALLLKDVDIIEYMLNNGFSVDYTQTFSLRLSILHLAVINRYVEIVELLCRYGANVMILDVQQKSPLLHLYNPHEKFDYPKKLKALEILINAKTFETCVYQLSFVLMYGPREAISLLLRSNINFHARDHVGRTLLYYLAVNRNPGIVEELKIHGNKFNVNFLDNRGAGPLHVTAKHANVKIMEYLLDRGARVNSIHNVYKSPPLFMACLKSREQVQQQSEQCVEMLLRHNADPQIVAELDIGTITVFDILTTDQKKNKLQSILAHLALMKKRGTAMTEMTTSKINSQENLKKDFKRYRRILNKKIARTASAFELLTANEKKMLKFLNNPKLVMKLKRIRYKKTLKSSYLYYFNTIEQRIARGLFYKTVKDKVAAVICQLLEYRFDESNIVVEKIIYYLDKQDIRQLYQMYS